MNTVKLPHGKCDIYILTECCQWRAIWNISHSINDIKLKGKFPPPPPTPRWPRNEMIKKKSSESKLLHKTNKCASSAVVNHTQTSHSKEDDTRTMHTYEKNVPPPTSLATSKARGERVTLQSHPHFWKHHHLMWSVSRTSENANISISFHITSFLQCVWSCMHVLTEGRCVSQTSLPFAEFMHGEEGWSHLLAAAYLGRNGPSRETESASCC